MTRDILSQLLVSFIFRTLTLMWWGVLSVVPNVLTSVISDSWVTNNGPPHLAQESTGVICMTLVHREISRRLQQVVNATGK